jgi:hypothetical protein
VKQFWMVWNPAGHAPVYKHDTEDSAVREAERLARANRYEQFYVLEAISLRCVDDMRRVELRLDCDDSQIPF